MSGATVTLKPARGLWLLAPGVIWMVLFLVLTSITFSLFGFVIGIWADSFEKLHHIEIGEAIERGMNIRTLDGARA